MSKKIAAEFAKDTVKETTVGVVDNLTFTWRITIYALLFLVILGVGYLGTTWAEKSFFEISPMVYAKHIKSQEHKCPEAYALINQDNSITTNDLDEFKSLCGTEKRSETVTKFKALTKKKFDETKAIVDKMNIWKRD